MDWQEAATAVRTAFNAQWAILVPAVRIAYRNGPKLDPAPNAKTESWIRFNVINGFSRHPSVGHRRRRDQARVEIQIFTPLERGDGWSRELGDTVAQIWDTVKIAGVQLGAPEFVPIGPDRDLPYWVDVVSTPYEVDHIP